MEELSTAFHERIRQMEEARDHRLSLLNAERDIQAAKSRLLAAKLAGARRLEQRRLLLERRAAELGFRALAARADIDAVGARHHAATRALTSVRGEIVEVEQREEEWDRFYDARRTEMEDFRASSRQFEAETREEVERLRNAVSELKSTLKELQDCEMYSNNAEIAAADARKADLLAKKAKLDQSLASARQFRALLQQQLQRAFVSQVGDQKTAETNG